MKAANTISKKLCTCLFLMLTFVVACKKNSMNALIDKCVNIDCKNGGTCYDGKCTCTNGYEGVYCETITSNRFQGTYHGWMIKLTDTIGTCTVTITPDVDPLKVKVNGLWAWHSEDTLGERICYFSKGKMLYEDTSVLDYSLYGVRTEHDSVLQISIIDDYSLGLGPQKFISSEKMK